MLFVLVQMEILDLGQVETDSMVHFEHTMQRMASVAGINIFMGSL